MKQKDSLMKNVGIIAIGKFSTQILTFLLLPLYTSYLTTEQYGIYDFIIAVVSFLTPFITLTLEESMFRFLIDSKSDRKRKYVISQAVIYTILSTIFFAIVIKIIGGFYEYIYTNILIIYTISVVMLSLTNALVRGMGEIKLFSIINFVLGILTITFNITFIVGLKAGATGLLLSTSLANIIVTIFIFFKLNIKKYINIKNIERNILKDMIKYSVPLIPNNLSWNIINLSDRLIIMAMIGESANGIYSVANKFPTLITTLYGFFNIAWVEKAAKTVKDRNISEYYSYIYKNVKTFLLSMCILIIAFMPLVFPILINPEYADSYNYIPILVIGTFFTNMSTFYGGIFTAYKNTKIIGKTTIITAILNLLINIMLIKFIGIYAAAISTLISAFTVYMYRKKIIKDYVLIKEKKNIWIYYIMIIIVSFSYYALNTVTSFIIGVICLIVCLYYNMDILLPIIKKFSRR